MVYPNPDQPRKFFNEESLKELSDSIKSQGVLVPILVQKNKNKKDSYLIIAGERRWRASKLAQLGKIKAIVISNKDEKTNYGIDIVDIILNSKYNTKHKSNIPITIEDHNHAAINIVIITILILWPYLK